MSEFGPAFIVRRKDKQKINSSECDELLNHIIDFSEKLVISDDEDDPVNPEFYGWETGDKKTAMFLRYSSFLWKLMGEEELNSQEKLDAIEILEIGKELDKIFPDTYEYESYYVEN